MFPALAELNVFPEKKPAHQQSQNAGREICPANFVDQLLPKLVHSFEFLPIALLYVQW